MTDKTTFLAGTTLPELLESSTLQDPVAFITRFESPLLMALGFLVSGSLRSGFDADHPRPNSMAYLLDADAGQAIWFSQATDVDSWTVVSISRPPGVPSCSSGLLSSLELQLVTRSTIQMPRIRKVVLRATDRRMGILANFQKSVVIEIHPG